MNVEQRLRWRIERQCQVPGCDERAPGTHPLCRRHAAMLPRDEYDELRFRGTDELLEAALETIGRRPSEP